MASDGQLDPQGFMRAYDASCNIDDSTTAASSPYRAEIFVEVLKASSASRCPTLSTSKALTVATIGSERRVFAGEFSRNYDTSCNFDDALSAASSMKASETYRDVLRFSQQSRCPTLSSGQVLRLAQAASEGREDARDFKMAYNTSCNYDDAYAAARCDRYGMYKGASSPSPALASALEVSEGGKTSLGEYGTNATPAPVASKGSVNVVD